MASSALTYWKVIPFSPDTGDEDHRGPLNAGTHATRQSHEATGVSGAFIALDRQSPV